MSPVLADGMAWSIAALAITVVVVRTAIGYAHRRGLMDLPGQRRSHRLPTPRGGGIGIVVACLVAMPGILLTAGDGPDARLVGAITGALAMVALIGWWDDHRALGAWPRLAVQLAACLLFALALLPPPQGIAWIPLLVLAGAWSINLHNFMDGIDALLAQQAMFVGAGLAVLATAIGQVAVAGAAGVLVAACAGFWWFNRSPARIFMGDVGSGSLGLLVFVLGALLWRASDAALWPVLILSSAFLVDAGFTLLNRIASGRRWYAPHREHVYQWLVRSGFTHARVAWVYTGWNLFVAAPMAGVAWSRPGLGWPACAGTFALAGVTWIVIKRRCLRRISHRDPDVAS